MKKKNVSMKVKAAAVRAAALNAEELIKQARPKSAPLHGSFPWNDKVAAHERRLDIAREIIRSVIEWQDHGVVPIRVRAFIHVPTDEKGYTEREIVKRSPKDTLSVIEQYFAQAIGAFTSARDMSISLGVAPKINALIKRCELLIAEIRSRPIGKSA